MAQHQLRVMGTVNTINMVLPPEVRDRFHVMGGDTVITWDPEVEEEAKVAETTFEAIIAHNFLAFDTTVKDDPKQIRGFDPDVERMVVTPPMRGG